MDKALEVMNQACVAAGVCGTPPAETEARRVVELTHPQKRWKGLLIEWTDKHVTLCWKGDKKVECCYSSEKPEAELFLMAQNFYTEGGYQARELHSEGTGC